MAAHDLALRLPLNSLGALVGFTAIYCYILCDLFPNFRGFLMGVGGRRPAREASGLSFGLDQSQKVAGPYFCVWFMLKGENLCTKFYFWGLN